MSEINEDEILEQEYLDKTIKYIGENLIKLEKKSDKRLTEFRTAGKDMWENSSHSSNDFDKIAEMTSSLMEFRTADRNYHNNKSELNKYKVAIQSPYFGRFDFVEDDFGDDKDKIYIGRFSIMDSQTDEIYVHDWRAPVSGMFYRCEVGGEASYDSPLAIIKGKIELKRQYKIENSKLNYYFDSSTGINDEILQEALGHNSSSKMQNIVETIQKEQDIIIRDIESDLLIVQGSAGSGKTSIALHRIAFLLYVGLGLKLQSNNVIIISPNSIFSDYISDVLPELGEANVREVTYEEITKQYLGNKFNTESRSSALEYLIQNQYLNMGKNKLDNIKFKGSLDFVTILERYIEYYENNILQFQDAYCDGILLDTKENIKKEFLNNKIKMSMASRLKRIERRLLLKAKSNSNTITGFNHVNCFEIYRQLFNKQGVFKQLAEEIELPGNIDEILVATVKSLNSGFRSFEDATAVLYLKLLVEEDKNYDEIRQVVIDEAQDYYPIQYKIFSILFKNAKFTVLGDYNQIIERDKTDKIYNEINSILNKKKSVKLSLKKSYRSSFEINSFSMRLLSNNTGIEFFERHEEEPVISHMENWEETNREIKKYVEQYYAQGFESVGIICKSDRHKKNIYKKLKKLMKVDMLCEEKREIKGGTVVVSSYMAKGLEFDAVIIYDASKENYKTELDKKLLYIQCTRALHRLTIFYTGEKSKFI